jgi:hypothetical protein
MSNYFMLCDDCGKGVDREEVHIECPACLRRPRCINCQADLTASAQACFEHRTVIVGPFCRTCRDVVTLGAVTTE